jgi:two-component sensor histidine kinase
MSTASDRRKQQDRVPVVDGRFPVGHLVVDRDLAMPEWFFRSVTLRQQAEDVAGRLGGQFDGFLNTDITELREAEERQKLLLAELNHRVKNTLTAVQSLAGQTLRSAESLETFGEKFGARLLALSRSHTLLARAAWPGAALGVVVAETLAPYRSPRDETRIALAGPAVRLGPTAAVALGMAFHELSTNAARHGALAVAAGRVAVEWRVDWRGGKTQALELCWRESGGPAVAPPQRSGFGRRLIERGLAHELGAEVGLDFAPAGLQCRIRLPLSAKVAVGPVGG